jgi:hypothetical protein
MYLQVPPCICVFDRRGFPESQADENGVSALGCRQLGSSSLNFLFATLDSGTFADFRWPDFSDHSRSVSRFYESNNNTLRWLSALAAT